MISNSAQLPVVKNMSHSSLSDGPPIERHAMAGGWWAVRWRSGEDSDVLLHDKRTGPLRVADQCLEGVGGAVRLDKALKA